MSDETLSIPASDGREVSSDPDCLGKTMRFTSRMTRLNGEAWEIAIFMRVYPLIRIAKQTQLFTGTSHKRTMSLLEYKISARV